MIYGNPTIFKNLVRSGSNLWKKSFLMISRLKMILSVVYYEIKTCFLMDKKFKTYEKNTFNNVFSNRIFPYHSFLRIF